MSFRRYAIIAVIALVGVGAIGLAISLYFTSRPSNSVVKIPSQTQIDTASPQSPAPTDQQAAAPPQSAAFFTDFTTAVPSQFSSHQISTTKLGKRKFLGPFGPEGVKFNLNDFPAHQFVHVSFDLVLIKSWNGCSPIWGPDVWTAGLADGTTLLRTTFCNCGFFNDNNEQNYPDTFPAPDGTDPHPAWTGAAESQTLGYMQSWGGPDRTYDCSSVYHFDWTFPHNDSSLALTFTSQPTKRDKVFGFMSFRAEAVGAPAHLTDAELKQAWSDLSSDDSVLANAAVWKLISTGDQAVDFFQGEPIMPGTSTTAPTNPYRTSRIRHVLQVIRTPAALELLAMLPPEPPMPKLAKPR